MLWGDALVQALLDTSDDAVFSIDESGFVASWNRSAERIFGRPANDALGRIPTDLFPPHARRELIRLFRTVLAGTRVDHFECEILRGDGLPVPISLSLCPVVDELTGTVVCVALARDITEQRLAQAQLSEIEERIRESEALAHVGSWLWDVRTGAVQWSSEFHRIHGVDPLDFEGTLEDHLRRIHRDDQARVADAMQEAVRTDRPFEDEYRVVRPSGDVRVIHARAHPASDITGEVLGLRGIGQDVTDQREVQNQD